MLVHSDARAASKSTLISGAHAGDILAVSYDRSGLFLASGGADKTISLYNASLDNFASIHGHKGAVLGVDWLKDSTSVCSASADNSLGIWDVETGARLRNLKGHTACVNSVQATSDVGTEHLVSASDDGSVACWAPSDRDCLWYVPSDYPVLTAAMSGHYLFTAGIDPAIRVYDVRHLEQGPVKTMAGHKNTVTCLAVSPDTNALLSQSMDSTVRTWDIRSYATDEAYKLLHIYQGAVAGNEQTALKCAWSRGSDAIAAAAADSTVCVWPVGGSLQKLPGHKGCVNDVAWSNNALASCATDGTILVTPF